MSDEELGDQSDEELYENPATVDTFKRNLAAAKESAQVDLTSTNVASRHRFSRTREPSQHTPPWWEPRSNEVPTQKVPQSPASHKIPKDFTPEFERLNKAVLSVPSRIEGGINTLYSMVDNRLNSISGRFKSVEETCGLLSDQQKRVSNLLQSVERDAEQTRSDQRSSLDQIQDIGVLLRRLVDHAHTPQLPTTISTPRMTAADAGQVSTVHLQHLQDWFDRRLQEHHDSILRHSHEHRGTTSSVAPPATELATSNGLACDIRDALREAIAYLIDESRRSFHAIDAMHKEERRLTAEQLIRENRGALLEAVTTLTGKIHATEINLLKSDNTRADLELLCGHLLDRFNAGVNLLLHAIEKSPRSHEAAFANTRADLDLLGGHLLDRFNAGVNLLLHAIERSPNSHEAAIANTRADLDLLGGHLLDRFNAGVKLLLHAIEKSPNNHEAAIAKLIDLMNNLSLHGPESPYLSRISGCEASKPPQSSIFPIVGGSNEASKEEGEGPSVGRRSAPKSRVTSSTPDVLGKEEVSAVTSSHRKTTSSRLLESNSELVERINRMIELLEHFFSMAIQMHDQSNGLEMLVENFKRVCDSEGFIDKRALPTRPGAPLPAAESSQGGHSSDYRRDNLSSSSGYRSVALSTVSEFSQMSAVPSPLQWETRTNAGPQP